MRLIPYPGGKDSLVTTHAKYLPKEGFDKVWETCAGTAAMTVNLFSGMNLQEIVLTEIETGILVGRDVKIAPTAMASATNFLNKNTTIKITKEIVTKTPMFSSVIHNTSTNFFYIVLFFI